MLEFFEFEEIFMANKMIVNEKTILIDFRWLFKAIREENGDWEKVEQSLEGYWQSLNDDE